METQTPQIQNQNPDTAPVNTMQENLTCIPICPTFTSGIVHGAGLAIGVGVVAGVTVGLIALLRKR